MRVRVRVRIHLEDTRLGLGGLDSPLSILQLPIRLRVVRVRVRFRALLTACERALSAASAASRRFSSSPIRVRRPYVSDDSEKHQESHLIYVYAQCGYCTIRSASRIQVIHECPIPLTSSSSAAFSVLTSLVAASRCAGTPSSRD